MNYILVKGQKIRAFSSRKMVKHQKIQSDVNIFSYKFEQNYDNHIFNQFQALEEQGFSIFPEVLSIDGAFGTKCVRGRNNLFTFSAVCLQKNHKIIPASNACRKLHAERCFFNRCPVYNRCDTYMDREVKQLLPTFFNVPHSLIERFTPIYGSTKVKLKKVATKTSQKQSTSKTASLPHPRATLLLNEYNVSPSH